MREHSPCRYCTTKRTATCHSTCKEYIDWKTDNDNANAQANNERAKQETLRDYVIGRKMKTIKRIKRK